MRGEFFARARAGLLGPTLSQAEVDGCNAILDAMAGLPVCFAAYALATAYKETNHAMHPVEEMGGTSYFTRRYDIRGANPAKARELGNLKPGDGARYHGRDYTQTTGRANYAKAAARTGVDLVAHPERIAELPIAAKVMRSGMTEGWFTGRGLGHYLPSVGFATWAQFFAARKVINGLDCAGQIAGYAIAFQTYIGAGA